MNGPEKWDVAISRFFGDKIRKKKTWDIRDSLGDAEKDLSDSTGREIRDVFRMIA